MKLAKIIFIALVAIYAKSCGQGGLVQRQFIAEAIRFENEAFTAMQSEKAAFTEWQVVVKTQTQIRKLDSELKVDQLEALMGKIASEGGSSNPNGNVQAIMAMVTGPGIASDNVDLSKHLKVAASALYAKYQDRVDLRLQIDRQYADYRQASNVGYLAEEWGYPTQKYKDLKMGQVLETSAGKEAYETGEFEGIDINK